MIFKKIFAALSISVCLFVLCAACSSETPDNSTNNSTTNDSAVTDSLDELKDDMKDAGEKVKDTLTDDKTETSDIGGAQSGASNSQTAN